MNKLNWIERTKASAGQLDIAPSIADQRAASAAAGHDREASRSRGSLQPEAAVSGRTPIGAGRFPGFSRVLILSLLLGGLNAPALERGPASPTAEHLSAASGDARPGQTTLTPSAPVSSEVPASSEEDTRALRQSRHLPTPLPWAVAAAGVITFAAGVFALWSWIQRGTFLQMLPSEVALQSLQEARRLLEPDRAWDYCFIVSKSLRRYVEEQFHQPAPALTTDAFLRRAAVARGSVSAAHRVLLGEFLQHWDAAAATGGRFSRPDLEAMHRSAMNFVLQSAVRPIRTTSPGRQFAPAKAAGESPAPVAAERGSSPIPFDGGRLGAVPGNHTVSV